MNDSVSAGAFTIGDFTMEMRAHWENDNFVGRIVRDGDVVHTLVADDTARLKARFQDWVEAR